MNDNATRGWRFFDANQRKNHLEMNSPDRFDLIVKRKYMGSIEK